LDFSKIKLLSGGVGKSNRLLSVPQELRVRFLKIRSIIQNFWKKETSPSVN
jgi:hypothetical protein